MAPAAEKKETCKDVNKVYLPKIPVFIRKIRTMEIGKEKSKGH